MIVRRVLRSSGLSLLFVVMAVCAARATAISGFVTSDTTWSGTVSVTGDVVVLAGAHLTIASGTRVYFKANQSDYDDPDGTPLKCDVIVKGALTIDGGTAPGDSVFFVSNPMGGTALPGDWGYVYFVPPSLDAQSSITGCTFRHGSRNLYLYLSAPPIAHCIFEDAEFAGLYADSSNSGSITDCVFRNNGEFGANMTGSSPIMLRCRFEANGDTASAAFGGLNLVGCRGRVAECTFASHVDGGNALTLDNSITTVARDTFVSNAGVALLVQNGNNGPAIDSCAFIGGKIGVSAAGPGAIRSSSFTGNAIGVEVIGNTVPSIGGSLATGCTFRNNPIAVRDTVIGVLGVSAQYCDWGATTEDSVWALVHGGVGAAPWTDPTHTQVFTSSAYGMIEGSVTWSGQVFLRGDVYVAPGAHLTIDPGTVIRMQVPKASWDTLSTTDGIVGECDLIVAGTLNALGGATPGDSIIVTSADPTSGNGWGFIHFLTGSSATVIGTLVEYAVVGFQSDEASPSFSQCTSRNNDDTGFRCQNGGAPILSQCVASDNNQIGIQVKDGTSAVVTGCRGTGNTNGLDVENSAATVTGSTFDLNGNEGVVAVTFSGSLRGCAITSNGTYGIRCVNSPTATFGTAAEPNDVTGSAFFNVFNASPGSVLQLGYTYWGTTSEDAILAKLTGPVNYSPWYDASHSTLYTSTRFGTLAGNTTWAAGTTNVSGDVIVPAGVTLTVSPGAVVKFRSAFSAYDDPRGTPGLCDLIVDGTLKCSGTPSTKVTLSSTFGQPGEWGRVLLLGPDNDSSRIEYTNVLAHSGMRMVNVTPFLSADSIGAGFDTSLAIVGTVPSGNNVGIASPNFSGGVGLALTGASGVLAGYRVSNGTTGVVVNGGSPSLTNVWVNNATTGVRFAGSTSATLTNSTTQSGKANGAGLHVTDASRPRVDVCVIKTTAPDTIAAIGLKVTGAGARADLGGGRWGSAGGNAFIGFGGAPHYAVADSSAPSDTTWAINAWWGTPDEAQVPARIIDKSDNLAFGRVLYSPILLIDPTPAVLWSLSPSSVGTLVRWTGEPRVGVRVWRADGTRSALEWPEAFSEVGRAFTSAQGRGEFADPAARSGQAYTYALSSLTDDASGLLALLPVQWNGPRLALAIAPAGRAAHGSYTVNVSMPAQGLAQVVALTADGRRAASVWNGDLPAGLTQLTWSASGIPSGVYWFRLRTAAGEVESRALIVR